MYEKLEFDKINDIVSDDNKILNLIKQSPHTYNSILQQYKDNGTMQQILRRRIKRLVNETKVWKLRVPGTRFGLALFCVPKHTYKIIIYQTILKVRIFYCHEYINNDDNLILNKYWELDNPNFNRWVYVDTPLHIPKYSLRDRGFRLWE